MERSSANCSPPAGDTRQKDFVLDTEMTDTTTDHVRVTSHGALDAETFALVRLAGIIAAGTESQLRDAIAVASSACRTEWVEEVLLQSYLFAGFPRALNATREWRRISGRTASKSDDGEDFGNAFHWRAEGEATCQAVYGPFYQRLRHNIRQLHPALDSWMIVEGYGKVLSRRALDLRRRELCIVAACAVARQDRQLHSHLHGAIHVGASPGEVSSTIDALRDLLGPDDTRRYHQLFARVVGR